MVLGIRTVIFLLANGCWALSQANPASEPPADHTTVIKPPTLTLIVSETQTSILEPSRLPLKLQSAINEIHDYLASEEVGAETEAEQVQLVNSEPIVETEEDRNFTVVPPPRPASAPGRGIVD
jgi:hypothetical protein